MAGDMLTVLRSLQQIQKEWSYFPLPSNSPTPYLSQHYEVLNQAKQANDHSEIMELCYQEFHYELLLPPFLVKTII